LQPNLVKQMDGIRVTNGVRVPLEELVWRFSRSGGPGGQNVNRRETRVELVFDVAGSPSLGPRQRARAMERLRNRLDSRGHLHIVVSEERSQAQNREIALERFRTVMAEALAPPPPARRKTKPSAGANRRRLDSKTRRSRLKRDRNWRPED
jgi:ribosome-associated protein